MTRRPRLRSTLAIAGLVIVASAAAATRFAAADETATAPSLRFPIAGPPMIPMLECGDLRAKAIKDTAWSYTKAFASAGLTRVQLPEIEITDAQARRTRDDGTVVVAGPRGKRWVGIFGQVDRATKDRSLDPRFVRDEQGDIWIEDRRPQIQLVTRCGTQACTPASGMAPRHQFVDIAWVLPEGARYRGVIEVAYDAWDVPFADREYCPPAP